jgi:hypothetical protein
MEAALDFVARGTGNKGEDGGLGEGPSAGPGG